MHEAKNTQRALVRIGFDGRVHKLFRGPEAEKRFENECAVLRYLDQRRCPFVPRLLDANPQTLEMVTSNCGARVQHISDDKVTELFAELEKFGVRHDDPFPRNITYRATDGRFCIIDFEFAEILDPATAPQSPSPAPYSAAQQIEWSGKTDCGRFRPNNEDAFLAMLLDGHGIRYLGKTGEASMEDADFLFAVSDGMGGERSGEFASRIAMEKITLQLPRHFSLHEDRFSAYSGEILGALFRSIHHDMLQLGRFDANCRNMGATLTLAWFRRGRVYFGHIGDSRMYHIAAGGGMRQVTEDHSHVGWLRRSGQLNEREARFHPRKNVLTQALGAGHRYLNPQMGVVDYEPGDLFVLCTDGVAEGLWDRAIEEIARVQTGNLTDASRSEQSAAERLVLTAIAESGRDNATAVVVAAR
jgi:PPM family protein phosphatase